MSYEFVESDSAPGIIVCMVDGNIVDPFVYITAENPPPWWVAPASGPVVGPFDTLDAAKAALIIQLD